MKKSLTFAVWRPGRRGLGVRLRPDGREKRRMAALGRGPRQHEIFAARSNQPRQRQEPSNRVALEIGKSRAPRRRTTWRGRR